MKKAFDQTVRDLKREVNKKVLKVPSIEQKVLDATSNEPWGPHGSLLADIANATRNYHEYQMIMSVIWKRINDTGKNWRHVYKALTVLEYLVAHGSERVIDDIREHSYQISVSFLFFWIRPYPKTLSDFQYIDSSGKDQGNNVRKKSQSLVVLVNDKERIQEVRQKAAANRDKYRSTPDGGMYRPGSRGYGDRYDDDRYGNREDDRNSYGREREWGSRDDDRYGRESYGRDGYRDDDYRGRSRSTDGYHNGSRSRSADQDRSRSNEDDDQYSSRGSGAKADDRSHDGSSTARSLDRKYSGQSIGVTPSYEDAVGASRSPSYSERDGDSSLAYAPKASSPKGASPSHITSAGTSPPALASPPASVSAPASAPTAGSASALAPTQPPTQISNQETDGFDEFDPRGSFSAAPTTFNGAVSVSSAADMDLLGSLSEFALVPVIQPTSTPEASSSLDFNSGPGNATAASPEATIHNQAFDDPFGDGPFKAIPSAYSVSTQQQVQSQPLPEKSATEFGGNPYEATYTPSGSSDVQPTPASTQELSNLSHELDILADILPPSAPSSAYQLPPNQAPTQPNNYQAQSSDMPSGFPNQICQPSSQTGFQTQGMALTYPVQGGQPLQMSYQSQSGPTQPNLGFYRAYNPQPLSTAPVGGYMAAPVSTAQQKKFLAKTNPLADIGVDFDAINRKEKRMEKPTAAAVTSTVTMGKAMGSGSGIGRAGATALRPSANPMMGMGMGINMQQPIGAPPRSTMPPPYNHMGTGGYGQQPYGGGYR
ncbi:ENTH/VHS family protein [Striga asiatica]|uniref:ENTH/VHS family protein n=1 Tax=Striga asiatica TaxID=4170 RepID=A0A5A7Q8R9_STRAF|nr:ENTH/VHS family protein [Striga asiatica]